MKLLPVGNLVGGRGGEKDGDGGGRIGRIYGKGDEDRK